MSLVVLGLFAVAAGAALAVLAIASAHWAPQRALLATSPAAGEVPAAPPPSVPATSTSEPAPPRAGMSPDEAGAQALALIHYPWQQLGYRVTFLGPRPGLLGGTIPAQRQILIFVRPDEPVDALAHVVAHELGHAVDKTYNGAARRATWLRLRGIPSTTPWFTCDGCDDDGVGAGDFAEAFASWQVGGVDQSHLGSPPDANAYAQLAPLFAAN